MQRFRSTKENYKRDGRGGVNMKKLRSRYNKGKKVRGVNRITGEVGMWRKTQVDKVLSATAYRMLRKICYEEEE
ncbi:MAG: hypothetical protein CMF55_00560 [Legionellales bacterium]|nr:hypothetical protein [Legionellales bacterium]|tara:strand:- start:32 stop:253 length:222 start_codon:yes stop_codon:yes gene_type:complete